MLYKQIMLGLWFLKKLYLNSTHIYECYKLYARN
jgi:hypothetical protein